MTGSGPNAAHHLAPAGSRSAITWSRGWPSTTGGNHPFSRSVIIRVVSNGPTMVASDHPAEAITNAHGQASSSDWSSTMSAAHRMDSATNAMDKAAIRQASCAASRSSSTVVVDSLPVCSGNPKARAPGQPVRPPA